MIPIEQWPERLEAALARGRHLRRALVLRQTDSTQDAARRMAARPGDLVTAWRQTAGRGRLGRRWLDTGDEGVACSFVLERRPPPGLTTMTAVAVARALESILDAAAPIGIEWPNDLVAADGGKVAGILVECADDLAIVGVGINVAQRSFPDDPSLRRPPRSLAMLGAAIDRLDVIATLAREFDRALDEDAESLAAEYRRFDRLRGRTVRFECAGRAVEGVVVGVDPASGIRVAVAGREEVLPAEITTLAVAPPGLHPT